MHYEFNDEVIIGLNVSVICSLWNCKKEQALKNTVSASLLINLS